MIVALKRLFKTEQVDDGIRICGRSKGVIQDFFVRTLLLDYEKMSPTNPSNPKNIFKWYLIWKKASVERFLISKEKEKLMKDKKELMKDRDWFEALYFARMDAFNKLKDAWKAHDSQTDWEMIDEIARNIYIKTKPDYDKC
jgi:hypothetical protein